MKKILIVFFLSILFIDTIKSQDVIQMVKDERGVYTIPCEVNGLKLRFIFDTGASSVSISLTEATFMLKNGYLNDSDITGTTNVQTADGKIAENYVINIKNLKIGSVTLSDVTAVVSSGLDAPLLLGQSVLDKLGHWSFRNGCLVLNEVETVCQSNISNIKDLKHYCKTLKAKGLENEAITAILNYHNGEDIEGAILFLQTWKPGNLGMDYLDKCAHLILNHSYENPKQKYDNIDKLAWFYGYRLNDKVNSEALYVGLARDSQYPKDYRWTAYSNLYYLFYDSNRQKANNYAKEAVDNGMYELAREYCWELIEKGNYTKAYEILRRGNTEREWTSSYLLAEGYIEGWWPVKNVNEGLRILDTLISNDNNEDAISYLCNYYLQKNDYNKVIQYASKSSIETTRNAYKGIAFYYNKEYIISRQLLEDIDLQSGKTFIISSRLAILGELYEKGMGIALDFDKAFNYYIELCKYDPAWGYGMLGDMFFLNELIEPDAERAYQYYVLGANNDSGYCCFRLALMNFYGAGTYKNEIKAKEYKEKAIKLGFEESDFKF